MIRQPRKKNLMKSWEIFGKFAEWKFSAVFHKKFNYTLGLVIGQLDVFLSCFALKL
jgi:hypothetical protein